MRLAHISCALNKFTVLASVSRSQLRAIGLVKSNVLFVKDKKAQLYLRECLHYVIISAASILVE